MIAAAVNATASATGPPQPPSAGLPAGDGEADARRRNIYFTCNPTLGAERRRKMYDTTAWITDLATDVPKMIQ